MIVRVSSPLVRLIPCQASDASQALAFDEDQVTVVCSSTYRLVGLAEMVTVGSGGKFGSGALPPPPPPPQDTINNNEIKDRNMFF